MLLRLLGEEAKGAFLLELLVIKVKWTWLPRSYYLGPDTEACTVADWAKRESQDVNEPQNQAIPEISPSPELFNSVRQ